MKPLFFALCLLPMVAVAQSNDATKDAGPATVTVAPKGSKTRLDILTLERSEIMTSLTAAIAEHPKAANKEASLKDIERQQANLKNIDTEIARVAKEPAQSTTWSGTAGATPKKIQQDPAIASQPPAAPRFESWDIFHNFGSKGN